MKISLDSPIFEHGNQAADVFAAGFLWLLFSLPVITIGPASCALYYTVVKVVRRKRETVGKAFLHSFLENLKQGIAAEIFLVLYGGVLFLCVQSARAAEGNVKLVVLAGVILVIPFAAVLPWIFPVMSRFGTGLVRQFQYAVYMAVGHLPTTIALLLLLCSVVILVILLPFLLLLLSGIYAYVSSFLIERVFQTYMKREREKYADSDDLPWYLE
ncbi:MAG: YesL family protein [Lachnospiraceae bacterium]|nr:YesL family protein [Lachnospiraceae bacterium]